MFTRGGNADHRGDPPNSMGLSPGPPLALRANPMIQLRWRFVNMIRCQSFSGLAVMSLITCLMVRYSSNE